MIIRIRCVVGFVRIEIEENKRLIDLKKKIEENLNVPTETQQLFLDGDKKKLLKDDFATLKECQLENGCLVELQSDIRPVRIKSEKPAVGKNETNKENINGKTPTVESKKDIAKKGEVKTKTKTDDNQPVFKSFDHFLKLRGYDTTDLPLNISYKSIHITKGAMIKIPFSVTLKHQPYRHIDHLEFMNVKEVKNFVDYWCETNHMLVQRGGWMYGYYKEDQHYELGIRAVCECIYEPPQVDNNGEVAFTNDPFLSTVDIIAGSLGLERIGLLYTHLPRKEYLTSSEIISIAKLQLERIKKTHYTGYEVSNFVTCTISLDPALQNEPLTNAYMISDLGMALLRDNVLAEKQDDPSHIALRNADKNELLPQILEGGRETRKFDTDWLIVRVNESAPKVARSIFKNSHFARENRIVEQTAEDAKDYFSSPHLCRGGNTASKYCDFHLILFAAKILGLETALTICEAINQNKAVEPVIEELLTSFQK